MNYNNVKNNELRTWVSLSVLIISVLLIMWAMFQPMGSTPITRNMPSLNMVVILILFVLVFYFILKDIIDRVVAISIGAILATVAGILLGFFSPIDVVISIKYGTLALLLGMGLITSILKEGGFFEYIAFKISYSTRGDTWKIMILFCMITYGFSLFVNNLTTIMVIVPMTLTLAKDIKFDPRPIIIAEIISSNLGGASSMVGDFPNMLIASETGILFHDFMIYMMPICLILLFVLFVYAKLLGLLKRERATLKKETAPYIQPVNLKKPDVVKKGLITLFIVILAFVTSDLIGLHPGVIAIVGGVGLVIWSGLGLKRVLKNIGSRDIIFFTCLFILVGALDSTGLLNILAERIEQFAGGNPLLILIVIMWSAAFITSFLNAGPSTALFIPLVMHMSTVVPHYLFWWSLSLGVQAGSSATLTGATAGSVTWTMMEKFSREERSWALTFKGYALFSVPLSLIFLVISTVYVCVVYYI